MVSPEYVKALKDAAVWAPEAREAGASGTLDAVSYYEREIATSATKPTPEALLLRDYIKGSATEPDQLGVYGTEYYRTLVSADHGTAPFKKSVKDYISGDYGTGGVARLLTERVNATSIVPLGQQTYNVAVAPDTHPIKEAIGRLLPERLGFMSLHGMLPGKLLDVKDTREIQALIGLGPNPSERSREAAEKIVQLAADLDLRVRVLIGNDTEFKTYNPETGEYMRDPETGEPVLGQLKAHNPRMTTNYAYRVMAQTGQNIPSVQLELTRGLRLLPMDLDSGWHVDKWARAMGVHMGYLLAEAAVNAMLAAEERQ
jgi:hypothetical protein